MYLQKNNITTFLAVTFSPVFLNFCYCSYYLVSLVCMCVFLTKFVDKWQLQFLVTQLTAH